jgi:hypothetical protein
MVRLFIPPLRFLPAAGSSLGRGEGSHTVSTPLAPQRPSAPTACSNLQTPAQGRREPAPGLGPFHRVPCRNVILLPFFAARILLVVYNLHGVVTSTVRTSDPGTCAHARKSWLENTQQGRGVVNGYNPSSRLHNDF